LRRLDGMYVPDLLWLVLFFPRVREEVAKERDVQERNCEAKK